MQRTVASIRRSTATLLAFGAALLMALGGCGDPGDAPSGMPAPVERDLAGILARDTLVVLAPYNGTSFFVYRGEPLGYEFELLSAFADSLGVELRVVANVPRDSLYELLNRGVGDVVAQRLVPSERDSAVVAFTDGLYRTPPMLVQQRVPPGAVDYPEAIDTIVSGAGGPSAGGASAGGASGRERASPPAVLPETTIRARLVTSPAELAGQRVTLPEESPYVDRLLELSDAITGDIEVVVAEEGTSIEELIRRVAAGQVSFTVAPANVARLRSAYYENVLVRPVLGPAEPVAWAVRRNAPELLAALDAWIGSPANQPLFAALYDRYFVDRRGYAAKVPVEVLEGRVVDLSPYDSIFRAAADSIGWDWRLLASQAYQESQFKPTARSWAGAVGVLQLMPRTARALGVRQPLDPEQNIHGGARYIRELQRFWAPRIADPEERLKFILASYNTGPGHVTDAQRLTAKNGGNPLLWEDVAYWLLQKSKRSVYTDPVVRYGFSRGIEPVTYVRRVLERFGYYQQFVDA